MRIEFNHGTLLCRGLWRSPAADGVRGLLWDDRVSAYRAPAYLHEHLCTEMRRLRVPISHDGRHPLRLEATLSLPQLRPYQEASLCAWQAARCRGLVLLPTGSGKTLVALGAMAVRGGPALCLVPTRVLLEQWCNQLRRYYRGPVGCIGDGEHTLRGITVATFESAYRHMASMGNRFDLLVVDEAHHFGTGMRQEALEMSTARARLGLTATAPSSTEAELRLERLIGRPVYELTVGDLAGSYLSAYRLISLCLDLTPAERELYDRLMALFSPFCRHYFRVNPTARWADFARAAARLPEGREAMAAWRRARDLLSFTSSKATTLRTLLHRHRNARVLIFTQDNHTTYRVAREHLIMPITCDIGRKERQAALDRFRRGELSALVSARVLNEGFDVPEADVAVVIGGSQSEREHTQRIGRVLRPAPGKRAIIYELLTRATNEVFAAQQRRRRLGSREAARLSPAPYGHEHQDRGPVVPRRERPRLAHASSGGLPKP